ncbi:MAG: hypothetical protein AAFQ89_18130 [Cyanobacteria bacterium J06626_18]
MTTARAIQLAFEGIFAFIGMLGTGLALPLLLTESQPAQPHNGSPRFHIIEVEITRQQ